MTRRELLAFAGAATCAAISKRSAAQSGGARRIETVTGPISPDALGTTLMHEHVLVDFIGAAGVSRTRYDADEVFKTMLPYVRDVAERGCKTIVECTPAFLGRDARLLRRLSEAAGVHLLTNTGFYGAANDKHVPAFAFDETAEAIARRWIREAERGVDDDGIKPAFMKIGVDAAPLSAIDAKLVRAAALTSRETGLPVASHTGTGAAAMEELDAIEALRVPASSFIWVHAQSERDGAMHVKAAQRGAWVEFDGIGPTTVDRHVDLVRQMKAAGLLDRVLVSHDAGWYHVGEANGGKIRPYTTLFTEFVPALRKAGVTDDEVQALLVRNPSRALTPRSR
jgi:phosphotriesterase-related protein